MQARCSFRCSELVLVTVLQLGAHSIGKVTLTELGLGSDRINLGEIQCHTFILFVSAFFK